MISIMIPCFSVDDKLGDWTNCRSLFRHLYELDLGVLLDHNNGNWWTDYSKAALSSIGDYKDFRRSCGTPA